MPFRKLVLRIMLASLALAKFRSYKARRSSSWDRSGGNAGRYPQSCQRGAQNA